jgi:hypothetical protein
MRRLIFSFVFLLIATVAQAGHKSEYSAYRQAIAAGDYAKAARHGEAAWRAAEKELGDTKTTAILAFNFAELVVINEPAKAIEPYARAGAIGEKIETGIALEDIAVGLDSAAFVLAPESKQRRIALEKALEARVAKKFSASPVSAYGWILLSQFETRTDDTSAALKYADRALAEANALGASVDKRLLRTALIYAGIMRVSIRTRSEQSVREAVEYLERSFNYFPPQKSIDEFDPLLARSIVWRATIDALAKSTDPQEPESRNPGQKADDFQKAIDRASIPSAGNRVGWRDGPKPGCSAVAWDVQKKPKYPPAAARESRIGASLIGFDMDGVRVKRAVVLADSFKTGFGAAAVEAMKAWTAKSPLSAECARNHTILVVYSLK